MSIYAIFCLLLLLALAMRLLNQRFFKIQATIAVTIGAFVVSMVLLLGKHTGWFDLEPAVATVLSHIDFHDVLINGMLGFLLFAGAISVDAKEVLKFKWEIGTLAFLSTLASALVVGVLIEFLMRAIGHPMPLIMCMLFGAVISPTDPIAVIATLKEIKAPKELATKVAGESLLNDGVGLVIFVTIYQLAFSGHTPTWQGTLWIFVKEALGGMAYGAVLGLICLWLMKRIQSMQIELLLTLCLASAGYVFAQYLMISGPLAMVVSGLMLGSRIREYKALEDFWELVDEVLNAILFLLIGLEILTFHETGWMITAGVLSIVLVLFVRLITVGIPMQLFKRYRRYSPYVTTILTWGGLRGALALAMALAIPTHAPDRNVIIMITYCVVLFSIIVQGLTAKPLVRLTVKKN